MDDCVAVWVAVSVGVLVVVGVGVELESIHQSEQQTHEEYDPSVHLDAPSSAMKTRLTTA